LKIAIGSRFYPASPSGERQQRRARAALLALDDVFPINLQFIDESFTPAGFQTLAVLKQDSRTITGGTGLRKPIVREMFDALAAAARAQGCGYFAYLNADIEVTAAALQRVRADGLDGYAFCRMDLDPATRAATGVQRYGLDMFAIDVAWWTRERHRFRSYIAGEACWDNVYAALVCAHDRGDIVDETPGIFHEQHERSWGGGLFAEYNGYLAALDAPYFTQWATYVAARDARAGTGERIDRRALIADVFRRDSITPFEYARHAARSVRARWRYAIRARAGRRAARTRQ
jgi:hypothetical protein